jgi:hypothetical protein
MARINIEITDTGATGETGGAMRVQTNATPHPSADASAVPAELAARAATFGAQNAGPAPSIGGTQASSAPVPFRHRMCLVPLQPNRCPQVQLRLICSVRNTTSGLRSCV